MVFWASGDALAHWRHVREVRRCGMTPERIAELRATEFKRWRKGWISAEEAHDPGDVGPYLTLVDMNAERDEMLNEIERLRNLSSDIRNITAHDLAVLQRLADMEERIDREAKP